MSELTPCCCCTLESIKRYAKKRGLVVITRAGEKPVAGFYGIEAFVHESNEAPTAAHRVAWFAELSDHCCC